MFNFLKSKLTNISAAPDADALVEEFVNQDIRHYSYKLESFTAGVKFQNAEPHLQRDVVMAMLIWFGKNPRSMFNPRDTKNWQIQWKMHNIFLHMLKYKLPLSEQDVVAILDWSVNRTDNPT